MSGQLDRNTLALGSYEPDDARTGVPPGTTLTPVSGNQVVTTDGTILQDLDITGRVEVRAANVIVRRCRIRGDASIGGSYGVVHCASANVTNLLIEDCTIACDASTASVWPSGVLGHDYVARRCRVYDVVDGFGVFNTVNAGPSNTVIEGNFVGPLLWYASVPDHPDGSHNDVIQLQGGVGTIMRYNKLWGYQSLSIGDGALGGRNGSTQTQTTHCIMVNATFGDPFDLEITENWFYAGEIGLNVGNVDLGVPGETVAIVYRNRFKDHTTWYSSSTSPTHDLAILYNTSATFDFGAGTANANVWMDSGLEIPLN